MSYVHHGLHSSARPVLTVTGLVSGKGHIWPTTESTPLRSLKYLSQVVTSETHICVPNLVQIRLREVCANEWNITKSILKFILTLYVIQLLAQDVYTLPFIKKNAFLVCHTLGSVNSSPRRRTNCLIRLGPPLQHCNSTQTATSPGSLERVNLAIHHCFQSV